MLRRYIKDRLLEEFNNDSSEIDIIVDIIIELVVFIPDYVDIWHIYIDMTG